jgi:hypothetical protein
VILYKMVRGRQGSTTMARGQVVLGGLLVAGAAYLAFGAWSTYTSPFITFGTGRVALSDPAIKDLEKLNQGFGRSSAGGALNRLSGRVDESLRKQRNAMRLAAAGAGACLVAGLLVLSGFRFRRAERAPLTMGLSATGDRSAACPDCGIEEGHANWCPRNRGSQA